MSWAFAGAANKDKILKSGRAVLLIGREFAVSGLRSIAASEGFTIGASELGKTKTFFQVLAISLLMISMRHPRFVQLADLSLYLVVLFSTWSAIAYFVRFWRKVDATVKHRRRAELLTADRQRRRALFAQKRSAMMTRRQAKAEKKRADFSARTADRPPST